MEYYTSAQIPDSINNSFSDQPATMSGLGTPSSCQFSSRARLFGESAQRNNLKDSTAASRGYSDSCSSGVQYSCRYFLDDVSKDMNTCGGDSYSSSLFSDSVMQPSSSGSINSYNGFFTGNGSVALSRTTKGKSDGTAVTNTISPGITSRNLTQTTPVTSVHSSGSSLQPSVSFILQQDSLKKKKKNLDVSKISETERTEIHKGAKRNLKYMPVGISSSWNTSLQYENTVLGYSGGLTSLHSTSINELYQAESEDIGSYDRHTARNDEHFLFNSEPCFNAYCAGQDLPHTAEASDQTSGHLNTFCKPGNECSSAQRNEAHNKNAKNNKDKRRREISDIDDQGILVGPPIQCTDSFDTHHDESEYSSKLKRMGNNKLVCYRCFWNCEENKTQHSVQTVEDVHAYVENNVDGIHSSNCSDTNSQPSEEHYGTINADVTKFGEDKKDETARDASKNEEGKEKMGSYVNEIPEEKSGWFRALIVLEDGSDHGSHLCFGCQKPVFDRYVIQVKDHGFWHADCLKCSNCHDNLSTQKSCYVKNEQVFCRNDYNILFGLSCVKCSLQFKREQDWMRVAGQHRYHIACFLCKICKRQLGNNEKYHLVNGTDIYCTNHYRDMVNGESSDGQQPPKKAKRNRTSYTEAQIKFLQERFLRDSNPDGNELEKIATHISLKKRVVQVWFQNNRARLKKSANNTKGGNQENKNPSIGNGIGGSSGLNDAMSIDWDNSLEHSSVDDHTYPSSTSPSQMRSESVHFMDSPYSLPSGLSGSLLCLPPGASSTATISQEPGSLGDGSGSGTSTCGTPRDQVSPHFPDMSNQAYQGMEPAIASTLARNEGCDGGIPGASSNDYNGDRGSNNNNNNGGCGSKGEPSPSIILSALRSSVMRDKFNEGCQRRLETRDQQEHDMRHHMMMYQDQPLRHHPHNHQQPYHVDVSYGSHMGIYGNLYNMYNGYGPLHSLTLDQDSGLSDPHPSFLRIKGDALPNAFHPGTDHPFQTHYNSESHVFNGSHVDVTSGFNLTRSAFSDTNGHTNNNGNTVVSGNSSPLSFLGANTPNPLQRSRPSPGQCSYLQGHQIASSPSCGQGHNYGRSNCGSPAPTGRQGESSYLLPVGRNGDNYFVDGENA